MAATILVKEGELIVSLTKTLVAIGVTVLSILSFLTPPYGRPFAVRARHPSLAYRPRRGSLS